MSEKFLTGASSSTWYVYVLECSRSKYALGDYDDSWKHAADECGKRLYVGSTNDIDRRMDEHQNGGCEFTSQFPPKEIVDVTIVEGDEYKARDLEETIASGYESPNVFVYQA